MCSLYKARSVFTSLLSPGKKGSAPISLSNGASHAFNQHLLNKTLSSAYKRPQFTHHLFLKLALQLTRVRTLSKILPPMSIMEAVVTVSYLKHSITMPSYDDIHMIFLHVFAVICVFLNMHKFFFSTSDKIQISMLLLLVPFST